MSHAALDGSDPKYRGFIPTTPWCMCIGAGVTAGMIPTWDELTRRVLEAAFGQPIPQANFQQLIERTRWPLDSWIQASANLLHELAMKADTM